MKRTLIVDLDCPYGINHFNLMPCEDCLVQKEMKKNLTQTIINPPPIAPTDYKFQWTKDSSSTDNITWDSGTTSTPVYYVGTGTTTLDFTTFKIT